MSIKFMRSWTESDAQPSRKIVKSLGLLIFFFMLIMATYPMLFPHFSTMAPKADKDDMLYVTSIIQFSLHSPLRDIYHLPFYYPTPYVTTYGHPLFGISAFFKIFQTCRLNFYQSYNLYIIFTLLIGAWGCYLLAREISGSRLFSLTFAAFYIFFDRNYLHFAWLNFLSQAYFPFVFYFFIRYMKSAKRACLLAGSFFAFMQFFVSIYYGFYLWVFILPFFLAFSLVLKICDWGKFLRIAIGLLVAFSLIMLIYYPFLKSAMPDRTASEISLLTPGSFFNSPKILFNMRLLDLGKYSFQKGYRFIPGYVFTFFLLVFFTAFLPKNPKAWLAVLGALYVVTHALFFASDFFFEFSFLLLCLFLLFLAWRSWPRLDGFAKAILLTLAASTLLLFQFETLPVLREISFFKALFNLRIIPGLSGLRVFSRLIPIATPFLIVLAATAAARMNRALKSSRIQSAFFASVIVLLLFLENYHFSHPDVMQSIPAPSVYQRIPFKKNKVVLELPFYDRRARRMNPARETRGYMANWVQHQNYLLNGKTSFLPKSYFRELRKTVPRFDRSFPNEDFLKKLIARYSLTHILFHWDKLDHLKFPMRANLEKIRKYGKIIYQDPAATILEVQEYVPVKKLTRTFSYSHLRRHTIEIILSQPYAEAIRLFLNDRLLPLIHAQGRRIALNLQKEKLATAKNKIDLYFDREIRLHEIIIR